MGAGWRNTAEKLLTGLGQRLNPSVYDTAWVVRWGCLASEPAMEEHINWLLASQNGDGSWGEPIPGFFQDQILCTLASLQALLGLEPNYLFRDAIRRGEAYLQNHLHRVHLNEQVPDLVGFELLLPALHAEVSRKGLGIPPLNGSVLSANGDKLRLIPGGNLITKSLTTVHSIESHGQLVEAERLHGGVFPNGSLGNSPAATAYYLYTCYQQGERPVPEATAYLLRVLERYEHPIYLYPFRNFELLWVMKYLGQSGLLAVCAPVCRALLQKRLRPMTSSEGVDLDEEFGIPDADCTAMAVDLKVRLGIPANPTVLKRFEIPGKGMFRTYEFERNASVSTNIHALTAIGRFKAYPDRERVIDAIVAFLLETRQREGSWVDKWHISPYYVTTSAVIALLAGDHRMRDLSIQSVDWLISTQRADGSWGHFATGTVEETAYVLLALQHAYRQGLVQKDVLHRGAEFLASNLAEIDATCGHPAMWVGKCLYAPVEIVQAAVLSALYGYEELFGR